MCALPLVMLAGPCSASFPDWRGAADPPAGARLRHRKQAGRGRRGASRLLSWPLVCGCGHDRDRSRGRWPGQGRGRGSGRAVVGSVVVRARPRRAERRTAKVPTTGCGAVRPVPPRGWCRLLSALGGRRRPVSLVWDVVRFRHG